VSKKGLTFEDLYKVSEHDDLVTKAFEAGKRTARNEDVLKETATTERLNGARVVGRSSTGSSEPVIYNRETEMGDIGAVFRRLRNLAAS
jgi:hypothetical protein